MVFLVFVLHILQCGHSLTNNGDHLRTRGTGSQFSTSIFRSEVSAMPVMESRYQKMFTFKGG